MQPTEFAGIKYNRTVKAYCEAIVRLVEKFPPDSITVQMICNETETSKQTFYNYFPDKYSLINYVFYRQLIDVIEADYYTDKDTFLRKTELLYSRHYANRAYLQKISRMTGQNSFPEWHLNFWLNWYKELVIDFYGEEAYTNKTEYYISVYISGLHKTDMDWFLSGCATLTPKEMAEMCYKHCPEEFKAIMNS